MPLMGEAPGAWARAAPWEGYGGGVCCNVSFEVQLKPVPGRLFLGEVQPAFSFSTAFPSADVLASVLQLPRFPPDLNFAVLHVPTRWWHPDMKMSLCRPVLPPRQANSSPDQRAPAASSASSVCLA